MYSTLFLFETVKSLFSVDLRIVTNNQSNKKGNIVVKSLTINMIIYCHYISHSMIQTKGKISRNEHTFHYGYKNYYQYNLEQMKEMKNKLQ